MTGERARANKKLILGMTVSARRSDTAYCCAAASCFEIFANNRKSIL